MLTPPALRRLSRQYVQAARKETTLIIQQRLASHALALAQLAQSIERDESTRMRNRRGDVI